MLSMRLRDRLAARIAAFSIIGVINGIVGLGTIAVMVLAGASPTLANVVGYGLGLIASFALNSSITFRARRTGFQTVAKFLGAFAIAFALNLLTVRFGEQHFGEHRLFASFIGTPAYVIAFYLLCEFWVFRRAENRPRR